MLDPRSLEQNLDRLGTAEVEAAVVVAPLEGAGYHPAARGPDCHAAVLGRGVPPIQRPEAGWDAGVAAFGRLAVGPLRRPPGVRGWAGATVDLPIVARLFQGAAGAVMMPSSMAPGGVVALVLLTRAPRSPQRPAPFDWLGQVTEIMATGGLT